ncbi:MAG TPA: 30S ribosomal protein S8 [Xylella sp.]
MSMTDPIADMLVRIKNAAVVGKSKVIFPFSKVKFAVVSVLKDEGYIVDLEVIQNDNGKSEIHVVLKYFDGRPVIETLRRVSRPGLRKYCGRDYLPRVSAGLGVAIVSTSKGIMTDSKAREAGIGGEVLCFVA